MTLNKLITALQSAKARGFPGSAQVVFGPEDGSRIEIKGGIAAEDTRNNNAPIMVLAPIKLDGVGGF